MGKRRGEEKSKKEEGRRGEGGERGTEVIKRRKGEEEKEVRDVTHW